MKQGNITISWGNYGGFYYAADFAKRLCLGWISFTYWPFDIDEFLKKQLLDE